MGRTFTFGYGAAIIALALLIPFLGSAESVVVTLITLMIGPLAIPTVWGLFSKYINEKAVWISISTAYIIGVIVKLGFSSNGFLIDILERGASFSNYIQENGQLVDALIGLVIPVTILIIMEITGRYKGGPDPKWQEVKEFTKKSKIEELAMPSSAAFNLPSQILTWVLVILGIVIGLLAFIDPEQQGILITFSVLLLSFPFIKFVRYIYIKAK